MAEEPTKDWSARALNLSTHLDGVRAKLRRAQVHLDALEAQIAHYFDDAPMAIEWRPTDGGEGSGVVLRAKENPPLALSVLVGEVAHQLRSAVDHVANGLVLAVGGRPTRRTAFPVLKRRPRNLFIAGGVSERALAAVDALQPYHSAVPERHPLVALTELWNTDKHRNLNLAAVQVLNTQVFLAAPDGGAVLGGQFSLGPARDGDLIGGLPVDAGWELDGFLSASGRPEVVLSEPGPWPQDCPVERVLKDIEDYVALTLVPSLEPHLSPK